MGVEESVAGLCPDVSVIIPTYKEAANLPVLIPRLCQAFYEAGKRLEVIVVDDNSPDDTKAVCRALAEQFPLRLETRVGERGLSSAVVHGLRLARGASLVVMDADLSHPPERCPDLVAALDQPGVDFVIGSRYVPGGSTYAGWTAYRWLNSQVATLLARPFTSVKDPLAGFFALRADTFLRADKLDPVGYKIGLELIVKCKCRNVVEVPIAFEERLHGQTKLTLGEQVNYLRHLKRLFDYKAGGLAQVIQFVTVGATGSVVDLLSLKVLLALMPFPLARGVAIWVAMTWNFYLNRRLTFSYARRNHFLPQYLMFCGACCLGAAVNWGVSVALPMTSAFFAGRPFLAAFCGIVAGTGFNYSLSRFVVFRKSRRQVRVIEPAAPLAAAEPLDGADLAAAHAS